MTEPKIPKRCPICNAEDTIEEEERLWSPPVVYVCRACGYWGETPGDLKYSPDEN